MSKRDHTVTFKQNLKARLLEMRHLAKNSSGGHAKTFWLGYDQACFELQQRYRLIELQKKKSLQSD